MGIILEGSGAPDPGDPQSGHRLPVGSVPPLDLSASVSDEDGTYCLEEGPTTLPNDRNRGFINPRLFVDQEQFRAQRNAVVAYYNNNWGSKVYQPLELSDLAHFKAFEKAALDVLERNKVKDLFLDPDGKFLLHPYSERLIEPRLLKQRKAQQDAGKELVQVSGILDLRHNQDAGSLIWFIDHRGNRRWQKFDQGFAAVIAHHITERSAAGLSEWEKIEAESEELRPRFLLAFSKEAIKEDIERISDPAYRGMLSVEGQIEGSVIETGILTEHFFIHKLPEEEKYGLSLASIHPVACESPHVGAFEVRHKGLRTLVNIYLNQSKLHFRGEKI